MEKAIVTSQLGWRPTAADLESWVLNSSARLLGPLIRITGDQNAAEDCIQAGVLEALDHFDQCQATTEAAFRSWVRKIVINKALHFRRKRLRSRTTSIEKYAATLTSDASGNGDFCMAVEMVEQVKLIVMTYPSEQREAFRLRFFREWTIQAISEHLDRNPDTISKWLEKILERIRKRLGNDSPLT